MSADYDPDGLRLPIKVDATSNGEFEPIPLNDQERKLYRSALTQAEENRRRIGLDRRRFLVSACGAATTLLAMNKANAWAGRSQGYFELPDDAALDRDTADALLGGREFIFDIQGHYVPPNVARTLKPACTADHTPVSRDYMACLGADDFIKDVFMDSDTDMMVLSFIPSAPENEPLTIEEAAATREIVDKMNGNHRLLLHGRVNPNQPGDTDRMDELANQWGVSAWKCYTQWGPDGKGFFLSDEDSGIPFIEKARALGVKNICVHKGIPFGRRSYRHSLCDDIGVVAKRFPDVNFMIYHSGYVPGQAEGPYDPERNEGIDSLIKTVIENDLGKHSNVYAELGSTWRFLSTRDPDSAAHTLGKLFKYLGEDNVVWGTDSVWYGSPHDQIVAFRSFQIAESLREQHGYPEITPELRAKVFGLNAIKPYGISMNEVIQRAANDLISTDRLAYRQNPNPHFRTYGPKTRRAFLDLLKASGA